MLVETESVGKVTLSCRILPEQKLHIAKEAKSLGLSMCQYVEALVLKNHGQERNLPKESIAEAKHFKNDLSELQKEFYDTLMTDLKNEYPEYSESEILVSTLIHVVKNRNAWLQRDLSYFLRNMTKGKFDSIIEKDTDYDD